MTTPRSTLLIALTLALLAGGLRFYRLGDWSFSGEELTTILESDTLFGTTRFGPSSQIYRLPRLIPLSHTLLQGGYLLFGRDEFGCRVLPALLGTLCVVLVFLGLDRLLGRPAALATAVLVCLWPEHLFHSQQNRFYIPASLFAWASLLLGAWSVKRQYTALAALAGVTAALAVLAHTLLAALFPGLLATTAAAAWAERQPVPWRRLIAIGVPGVAILLFGAIHLARLGLGWNANADWGYSVAHSVQAAVNRAGYPVVLLAALGAVDALRRRDGLGVVWVTWAGVWAGAALVLPVLIYYAPMYNFPLTAGVFVLAGYGVGRVYERLRERDAAVACGWVAVVCALGLPGVVSHFADGSRYDFRTAGHYIAARWRPGDRVLLGSANNLRHYLPPAIKATPVSVTADGLRRALRERPTERAWLVVHTNRAGKSEPLWRSLRHGCTLQTVIRQPRLDYFDYGLEIYLYDPCGEPPLAARVGE